MNEIVKIENVNGINVVSSRDIAEGLGKEHSKVIRSIENILTEPNVASLIIPSTYIDKKGESRKEYLLTKKGFILYMFNIQGYQSFKTAYIDKFEEMEKVLQNQYYIPQTYKDALKLAYEQQEEIQQLTSKIEEDRPKVIFADAVSASSSSILVGELAKVINQRGVKIGVNGLFLWLRNNGYLCSRGESWNQPTQYSMNLKLMEIKKTTVTDSKGNILVKTTTKITPKGQTYFINKFLGGNENEIIEKFS